MARDPLMTTGPVETKLRESQRTLATLMDNLPGMAYRCRNDRDWTMDFVSQGSMDLTGYCPAELIANATTSYVQLIVPEDRERVDRDVQAAVAAKSSFQIVYCIAPKTGPRKWVWEQGCGVFSKVGELVALEGFITDITEARHAQEGLRDSEARYRLLTEAAFEGVFIHDQGVLIEGNPALGRIFGYELDEMVGRNMMDFIPTAESRDRIATHMATNSHERYEVNASHSSGAMMTAIITGRNTTYRGKPARVTTVQDITEAKRIDVELRGRETQLLEAQAIAHLGSWDWNIVTGEMTGTDELRRIYGFGPSEVLTPDILFERIHPDDGALVREAVDAAMEGGTNFSMDHRIVRSPGDVRHFHVEGRIIRDDAGKPVHLVGAGQDVTDRHEADIVARALIEEQAARASAAAASAHDLHAEQVARRRSERGRARAEFRADATRILSSSFDTTTTLDQLAHLCVRFLDTCCAVSLYGGDEDGYVALVHSAGHQEAHSRRTVAEWKATANEDHILGERQRRGEAFVIGATDATEFPVHGILLNALGARVLLSVPIGVVGSLMGSILFIGGPDRGSFDAEERAGAEELGMSAGVALQAAQMYHDALAATAARDEVLAVVAHDLRNPLSTIHMGSSLALELMAPEPETPGRQQLEIISRAAKKMNQLIQDLLDATRLESGRLTLELAPSQARAIIDEAVEMLLPLATHAGIRLHAGVITAVDMIRVDRFRIQQVLSNLIGNALKFTPSGGSVAVSAAQGTGEVWFRVTDTGQGIAADQLSQVFARFWQARRTDRRGLGLGLAIAQGIVEAHGGRIQVDSVPGAGSTFAFTIPAPP